MELLLSRIVISWRDRGVFVSAHIYHYMRIISCVYVEPFLAYDLQHTGKNQVKCQNTNPLWIHFMCLSCRWVKMYILDAHKGSLKVLNLNCRKYISFSLSSPELVPIYHNCSFRWHHTVITFVCDFPNQFPPVLRWVEFTPRGLGKYHWHNIYWSITQCYVINDVVLWLMAFSCSSVWAIQERRTSKGQWSCYGWEDFGIGSCAHRNG